MDSLAAATAIEAELVSHRRYLHIHPEPTGKEDATVAYIEKELAALGIPYDHVENGGVIGYINKDAAGKTVLLRADIDALTMQEDAQNLSQPKVCVSSVAGVAHTCGHDAHTAMLLGAAKILNANKGLLQGRVLLFFERGEEGGGNIYYMMQYLRDHAIQVDAAWGIHVHSEIESGKMAMAPGPCYAGALRFAVTLEGKGGHGARPDMCHNPIECFAAIHQSIGGLKNRCIDPAQRLTYTVCQVEGGKAGNIIPNEVTFGGTCRFYSIEEGGEIFRREFQNLVEHTAKAYQCTAKFDALTQPGLPLLNNGDCVAFARSAVAKAIGAENVLEGQPKMGSESMAWVAYYFPTAYVWLGINNPQKGIGADHHNPKFDVDEDALKIGTASTVAFAAEFLNGQPHCFSFTPGTKSLEDLKN